MNDAVLRNIQSTDWITIILCCSVVALVIAKSLFYNRFLNFIILPFNNKYIFLYNKKEKLSHWFNVFLSIFQVLNLALFLFILNKIFSFSTQSKTPTLYFIILGVLLVFFIVKIFFQLGNAFIFNISGEISEYLFKKISYLNYSSFVMFMANILLTYVLKDSKTVAYVSLFLIVLINAIGWVTVIKNYQKLITNNFLYFILYLCTLEIAPIVLIGDYFKD
jgi:ABC-type multidrug transport system fused ATPase/permease subunit